MSVAPARRGRRATAGRQRAIIALLGVPTLGLALSITAVTTYVPVIARQFTGSTTIIGMIIGTEGLLALFLPLAVGTWSDQGCTRVGGRMPFVLGAALPLAVALILLGFARSLLVIGLLVGAFFVAYFIAYEPYRALYPDLVSDDAAGRAQSIQALFRGSGTGLALVGGGLLFGLARWLPFVSAAVVSLVAVVAFSVALGAVVMSLPYAILMPMMPERSHGALTGFTR